MFVNSSCKYALNLITKIVLHKKTKPWNEYFYYFHIISNKSVLTKHFSALEEKGLQLKERFLLMQSCIKIYSRNC